MTETWRTCHMCDGTGEAWREYPNPGPIPCTEMGDSLDEQWGSLAFSLRQFIRCRATKEVFNPDLEGIETECKGCSYERAVIVAQVWHLLDYALKKREEEHGNAAG